jgi:hypothetical protein
MAFPPQSFWADLPRYTPVMGLRRENALATRENCMKKNNRKGEEGAEGESRREKAPLLFLFRLLRLCG